MKILHCHIENFGKLSQFSMDFSNPLSIICHENGWGKSTLATFIRVMFYGFEGERKRYLNERLKYKPWQGGVYGGSIEFELRRKKYRMTRIFGKKESEDSFELRDLEHNLLSSDYSSDIGKEIFEVNREAFMRTVFIRQGECATKVNGDINAKIGNFTMEAEELSYYESADERMKDYLNKYSPTKKTGALYKWREEALRLETEIRKEFSLNATIDSLQEKLEEGKNTLEILRKKQDKIIQMQRTTSQYKEISAKKEQYENIKLRFEKENLKWNEIRSCFPTGIPRKDELEKMLHLCGDINALSERTKSYEMDNEEERLFKKYSVKFQEAIPLKEEFDYIKNKSEEWQKQWLREKEYQISNEEQLKLTEYRNKLGDSQDFMKKLNRLQMNWNERSRKIELLHMKKMDLEHIKKETKERSNKKVRQKMVISWIIGIALFALAGLVARKLALFSVLLMVTGISCFLLGFIQRKKPFKEKRGEKSGKFQLEEEIKADEQFIQEIARETESYLWEKGLEYNPDLVPLCFNELYREAMRYEELERKSSLQNDVMKEQVRETTGEEIALFLKRYDINFDEYHVYESIGCLEKEVEDYKRLKLKKQKYQEYYADYKEKKNIVEIYIKELGMAVEDNLQEQLFNLKNTLQEIEQLKKRWLEEKNIKEAFEEINEIEKLEFQIPEEELGNLVSLNKDYEENHSQIEKWQEMIRQYTKMLDDKTMELDVLEKRKDQLKILNSRIEEHLKKYNLIQKTRELLAQAKENLTSRYMMPLKKSFSEYYEILGDELAKDYYIDANANLTLEELGKQREIDSLSEGYQDLAGLCLRLAFIDAMYEEEKPVLILDDPFVNLDQKKVAGGKRLLERLSKEFQLIYFTCHESRA